MTVSYAVSDNRGRITVAKKDSTYRVTELDDGAILLEPAQLLTAGELALRLNPGFAAGVADSIAHPERLTPYRRRSPRRTDADA